MKRELTHSNEEALDVPNADSEEDPDLDSSSAKRVKCPFLDTINRQVLDFDSDKLCSVTLTNRNVYICLVCGKYFEGRGRSTPAFTHSLQCGHFVFLNVDSGRAYCLPDSYEIFDSSLDDIRRCLSPSFTVTDIDTLGSTALLARDVHGVTYLPGFVGLNNLHITDDLNVILHTLGHIEPLREFFLQPGLYASRCSALVREFGLVLRKLWSAENFKSTVSPQELVHRLSVDSKRRFATGKRSEAVDLLIWLLNALKKGLGPPSNKTKDSDSVIFESFQGVVEVVSLTKRLVDNYEEQLLLQKTAPGEGENVGDGWIRTVREVPFTLLSLEMPPCPLFRDAHNRLVIPQVPLYQLLQKFDGETWTDQVTKDSHVRRQYRIKKLPRYLILHLVRFTKNNFTLEKNPTIVTFPVKNLEMKDFLFSDDDKLSSMETEEGDRSSAGRPRSCPSVEELQGLSTEKLVEVIQKFGSELHRLELQALNSAQSETYSKEVFIVAKQVATSYQLRQATKYDLVANICHETKGNNNKGVAIGDINNSNYTTKPKSKAMPVAGSGPVAVEEDLRVLELGEYKVHLHCRPVGQWYELQDLHVTETSPQQIGVSESYILVYEKKLPNTQ
eukprot:gene5337-5872_t